MMKVYQRQKIINDFGDKSIFESKLLGLPLQGQISQIWHFWIALGLEIFGLAFWHFLALLGKFGLED